MIEQGYPGGPRPEGAHRAVDCHCGMGKVARRTLIADVNRGLAQAMAPAPDGRPWAEHILRNDPVLRARLARALR
ncbi:hypothetical protein SEA_PHRAPPUCCINO_101 [Mycobacterium phage Phrappuccino]|uniref:Uncharacterized protein n=1 Tax=Mycobacterium phage Phrappuccino TaxID=2591223 RepID=A0A514DDT5_9CAUD|nr:hypothetical protein KHQ87_gp101 [Mycobacterium phage Phrappuccino]QDH91776.1 hypothetical protein SEA_PHRAPPUCCINO_101 [Mycobacterium phage Phrappuccino]QIQ63218.1 hypothetical protein SEA_SETTECANDELA_101 [Mycobacterium phage Settecandela]